MINNKIKKIPFLRENNVKKLILLISTASVLFLSGIVNAAPLTLISQADNWDYNFGASLGAGGGDNTYATFVAGYTGTNSGNGPFGNSNVPGAPYNSLWSANQALYLQKTVDLSGLNVNSALLNLAVDNGASVFVNGTKVFGASAGGFTNIWEYSQGINTSPFVNGINTISVIGNDYGGLTYFDMELTADVSRVVSTPEPSSLIILGLGMIGLFVLTRRRVIA